MKPLFYYQVFFLDEEEWRPCAYVTMAFDVKVLESRLLQFVVNTGPSQFRERELIVKRCHDGMLYVRRDEEAFKIFEMRSETGERVT